jgi:outer membrane protein assembly factor BamB
MPGPPVPDVTEAASPPRRDLIYDQLEIANKPLGRGGQAVVYEAHVPGDESPDRIALKEPLRSKTLSTEATERFLAEARSWAVVDAREREKPRWRDSEHVVGVIDTGDDLPWIAMEYMDGGGLDTRLEETQGGLSVAKALWIGECVCRGLDLAHNYGIAHLDLKPANVLFRETPDGRWDVPKLADWGLARMLAEQTGSMDGRSPKYSAPEQFEPDRFGDPDTLTDVYQAGALVYTMLTGEAPYTGAQFSVIRDIIEDARPDPPSTRASDVPDHVDEAVLRALAPQKADRYDGVREFGRALTEAREKIGNQSDQSKGTGQHRDPISDSAASDSDSPSIGIHGGASTRNSRWEIPYADLRRSGNAADSTGPTSGVEERWSFQPDQNSPRIRTAPVATEDLVFVAAGWSPCHLYAIERKSGEVSWKTHLGKKSQSSPIIREDTVYLGEDGGGTVWAVDIETGEERWQFNAPNWIDRCSPAITKDNVYVGSGFSPDKVGHLHALNRTNGMEQWRTPNLGSPVETAVAVSNELSYATCKDGTLYAVSVEDGSIGWKLETDVYVYPSTPAISNLTECLYATVSEGNTQKISVINLHTGSQKSYLSPDLAGTPAIHASTLFASGPYSQDGLYAIDLNDGSVEWESEPGPGFVSVYADGAIYTGGTDGVYCLDAEDGETLWSVRKKRSVKYPPAVLDNEVYVVEDDTLYALTGE